MKDAISLNFESRLSASAEQVWDWITSVQGISAEMWPFFRMTVPRHISSLQDLQIKPGTRLFRSYFLLLGVLPVDRSDLTLLELRAGRGFIEQSPMASMRLWRHERFIEPCPSVPGAVLLIDRLTFRPRMARRFVRWFVRQLFNHRHHVLRTRLGNAVDA
jgi:ligand-binding SRPBCC domain-containing protein